MPEQVAKRLVVFGDGRVPLSRMLVSAACDAALVVPGLEVAAVCEVATAPVPAATLERRVALAVRRQAGRWSQPHAARGASTPVPSLEHIAGRNGVPLMLPSRRRVNSAAFREELRGLGVDLGLSLYCPQRFHAPLLAVFPGGVANFHNGLLPHYRGLAATAWSLYEGEPRTGFTFHWMSEGLDEGPVLLRDSVEVVPGRSSYAHEVDKTRLAVSRLREVLACMVAGDPGEPQADGGRYFSRADQAAMRDIEDPSAFTSDELCLRLWAFDSLTLHLGRPYSVTELSRVAPGARRPRLAFTTADGVVLAPARIERLPARTFLAYRAAADAYRRVRRSGPGRG